VKRSLEEEMAAALDGQFFWEQTTKYEDANTGATAEIRRAQRRYSKLKKIPKPYIPTSGKESLVKARIEAKGRLPDEMKQLRAAIIDIYGLTETEFEGAAPRAKFFPARSHYIWAALRYNPNAGLAEVGRLMDRHHTTIMYNRNFFEKKKHLFQEKVKKIDEMFGFKE
jgi:hypothetical protein